MSPEQPLDVNELEVIEEGPASKVSRAKATIGSDEPQWVVVKCATVVRKFAKEPHDIVKELRILSSLSHPNVVNVLASQEDAKDSMLSFWMPLIPISLSDLLVLPKFSPHSSLWSHNDEEAESARQNFITLAKSIIYQTLLALAYLHDDNRIAHRDIKPRNILLNPDGCVKLIDFGIAWKDGEDAEVKQRDLWPEDRPKLYFEVSTGPYRAPELLFGGRNYDAFALDLWSLGATFAEFFTPFRLRLEDEEDEDEEYEDSHDAEGEKGLQPFYVPQNVYPGTLGTYWERDTLFNGNRGELGLAWSIFKIRGTPIPETWPAFEQLPDAGGVVFMVVPPVQLASLLPHLPEKELGSDIADLVSIHSPKGAAVSSALDLLSRFLVYPPESRIKAERALIHPWFGDEVLLPQSLNIENVRAKSNLGGKTLGQYLRGILGPTWEHPN